MAKRPTRPSPGAIARTLGAALGTEFPGGAACHPKGESTRPRIIPSGIDSIDVAIGIGGYPEGRVIISHGGEGTGKTTQALHACVEVQKLGGVCLYLDYERKLDLPYAQAIGVDVESMIVGKPKYIEQGFNMLTRAAQMAREADADVPILFVWDSLQAAVGKRTFDAEYEKENYSPEAAAYARNFAKFMPALSDARAILFCISQVRMSMDGFMGGAREKIGVGKAPLFYASIIFQYRNPKARGKVGKAGAKDGDDREGNDIEVVLKKNQVGRPFTVASFPILFGTGVDRAGALLSAAEVVGVAVREKAGWFTVDTCDGPKRVQGVNGMRRMASMSPEVFESVREKVRAQIGKATIPTDESEAEDLDADTVGPTEGTA